MGQLDGKTALVTGAARGIGRAIAEKLAAEGADVVACDLNRDWLAETEQAITALGRKALTLATDVSQAKSVQQTVDEALKAFGRLDILINNAANNPKMESSAEVNFSRLENFPIEQWHADLAVGLTGAHLCSQVMGAHMAQTFRECGRRGVILNIASDLAVIGPDQRIYRQPGLLEHLQPAKPVTYSVVKAGLVGLTRYLATYWADAGVRVNAVSPGGIYNGQPDAFVQKLTNLIPMARMARLDEYQGTVLFLVSDASSYMTGHNLVVDGGRTAW